MNLLCFRRVWCIFLGSIFVILGFRFPFENLSFPAKLFVSFKLIVFYLIFFILITVISIWPFHLLSLHNFCCKLTHFFIFPTLKSHDAIYQFCSLTYYYLSPTIDCNVIIPDWYLLPSLIFIWCFVSF
jgi:hypothetical protein